MGQAVLEQWRWGYPGEPGSGRQKESAQAEGISLGRNRSGRGSWELLAYGLQLKEE